MAGTSLPVLCVALSTMVALVVVGIAASSRESTNSGTERGDDVSVTSACR